MAHGVLAHDCDQRRLLGRYRHAYQEVEDFNQFDAVTKFSAQVDDVKRLPDLMRQAFRAATTGAPGPRTCA